MSVVELARRAPGGSGPSEEQGAEMLSAAVADADVLTGPTPIIEVRTRDVVAGGPSWRGALSVRHVVR